MNFDPNARPALPLTVGQLADELERLIISNTWEPGAKLPLGTPVVRAVPP